MSAACVLTSRRAGACSSWTSGGSSTSAPQLQQLVQLGLVPRVLLVLVLGLVPGVLLGLGLLVPGVLLVPRPHPRPRQLPQPLHVCRRRTQRSSKRRLTMPNVCMTMCICKLLKKMVLHPALIVVCYQQCTRVV